ncbi:hypothetical protein A9Q88_10965 [Gammaproteobacteria bacterium 50_400_T64]|nr:hypothetical protein A9Q88_10965 [Gammaproteobacteria bacterium 50_400_T64]
MNSPSFEGKHLHITPAGAYHCITSDGSDPASKILKSVLGYHSCPAISAELIDEWAAIDMPAANKIITRMESLHWLECLETAPSIDTGKLEDILPDILQPLSANSKILLADGLGFYISAVGIPHETAEELSALSADLSLLSDRHQGLLQGNLKFNASNWALVDAGGFGQISFWPLRIDKETFNLIIIGMPQFERPEFAQLVWLLHTRYASRTNSTDLSAFSMQHKTTG